MFQATYRIRHLKSNEMHYCLNTKLNGINPNNFPCNEKIIKERLEHKDKLVKGMDEDEYEEFKTKPYIFNLYINNIFEHNVSILYLEDLFEFYLEQCNYKRDINDVLFLNELELMKLPIMKIEYHNIPDITNNQYRTLALKDKKLLSDIENASLNKYIFKTSYDIEGIDDETICKLWKEYRENHSKFNHISIEKNIRENVFSIRTLFQNVYTVFQPDIIVKYNAIIKLVNVLGCKNSQSCDTIITRQHIENVNTLFNEDEDYSKLFGIKKIETDKDMSIQSTLRKINQVLNYWGFSQVKSTERKRKRVDGKQVYISDFQLVASVNVYDITRLKRTMTEEDRLNGEYLAYVYREN